MLISAELLHFIRSFLLSPSLLQRYSSFLSRIFLLVKNTYKNPYSLKAVKILGSATRTSPATKSGPNASTGGIQKGHKEPVYSASDIENRYTVADKAQNR
jgi:hypothetical protein